MDRARLASALREEFDPGEGELRAVVRAAGDLADDCRYAADVGASLTPSVVVSNLADGPDGGLAERWNWWIGALEVAHGGYERFQVRRYRE